MFSIALDESLNFFSIFAGVTVRKKDYYLKSKEEKQFEKKKKKNTLFISREN